MQGTWSVFRTEGRTAASCPHRRVLAVVLLVLAIAGAAGAVQLMAGASTPPVADLEPLGLTSWVLPGVWLLTCVGAPSGVAACAAWQRWAGAPELALLAAVLLVVELVVQIPFVGLSLLQLVLALWSTLIVGLALDARRRGWRRAGRPRGQLDGDPGPASD